MTVATESRHDASGERLCVLIHALLEVMAVHFLEVMAVHFLEVLSVLPAKVEGKTLEYSAISFVLSSSIKMKTSCKLYTTRKVQYHFYFPAAVSIDIKIKTAEPASPSDL